MFLWTKRVDGTLKELTMIRKKAKNTFKNKVPVKEIAIENEETNNWQALQDPFLKTVKLHCSALDSYIEFKMKLDSALEAHNLIALEVVTELGVNKDINLNQQAICHCLNGQQLVSIGTITLRWKGKDFRKIFQTTFHVIDSHKHQVLPWQIILGAETIHEHGILKFAGFGGRAILPKEEKGKHLWILLQLKLK